MYSYIFISNTIKINLSQLFKHDYNYPSDFSEVADDDSNSSDPSVSF